MAIATGTLVNNTIKTAKKRINAGDITLSPCGNGAILAAWFGRCLRSDERGPAESPGPHTERTFFLETTPGFQYTSALTKRLFRFNPQQQYQRSSMANHKSALRRAKQDKLKRMRNRMAKSTLRTGLKKIRGKLGEQDMSAASDLGVMFSLIDRTCKRGIIHKNKANRLKSRLTKHVDALSS
jgi:small subunit ribosomal protein S20